MTDERAVEVLALTLDDTCDEHTTEIVDNEKVDDNYIASSVGMAEFATRILAALPEGWALERLCGDCGYPLRDWGGHACPDQ